MERLIKTGKLKPKASKEITASRIGIDFEKLDRNVFDPNKAYDKLGALGVKWVRIQSGWARTEKEQGVYDFTWLDSIVDNLLQRGMEPWICLCYGNGLYDSNAQKVFGAVGCPPIHSEEAKLAWSRYAAALARRYAGKVNCFEVWNEPDGKWCWKHGVNGTEYGHFVIDTGKAIKEGNPSAKIIGGSACMRNLEFLVMAFEAGMGDYIDALTFHEYTTREELVFERVTALRGLVNLYNPEIKIIQGESGSQSRSDGAGALAGGAWTPEKQAKQLLRHTMADLMTEVLFTSYFSCMDMIEALNGTVGDTASYLDYGYFGVLGADFDENGYSTGEYTPKPSYYALQNICSLFSEDTVTASLPVILLPEASSRYFGMDCSRAEIIGSGFQKSSGGSAFVYWKPTDLMTTTFEGSIRLQAAGLGNDIKLIDLMDGTIYRLPKEMVDDHGSGSLILEHIPIKDYPLVLTFGNFAEDA